MESDARSVSKQATGKQPYSGVYWQANETTEEREKKERSAMCIPSPFIVERCRVISGVKKAHMHKNKQTTNPGSSGMNITTTISHNSFTRAVLRLAQDGWGRSPPARTQNECGLGGRPM
jgi:hypothetical protein